MMFWTRVDRQSSARSTPPPPEQVPGDRFARGEIDEQDYRERLNVLRDHAVTRA